MIDLEADRSLMRKLLASGFDVYFIDWGLPGRAQRWHGIDDYVSGYLDRCVDVIRQRSRAERINLIGICQGGVFSTCYAALFPQKVRNLALTVTPLDFHGDLKEPQAGTGYMNGWARSMTAQDVDDFVDVYGSAPGALVGFAFLMMNPVSNMTKYTTDLIDVLDDDAKLLSFLRMERWIADRPDHPGEVLRQWLKDLYQDNKLIRNQLQFGGRTVDLRRITMPVLNIYATGDTLVPVSCSRGGSGIISARAITPNWQCNVATSGPLSAAKHRKFWGPRLPNGLPNVADTTMQLFYPGVKRQARHSNHRSCRMRRPKADPACGVVYFYGITFARLPASAMRL